MDEHRHPPVRLLDRAARPIITPHARLPYSMPHVVFYTTLRVRHALDQRFRQRQTQQLHRTGTTNKSTRMWVPVCITLKFPWLTTDKYVHCLYHGAPQAVNNMHCGAVQVAAPQIRGDPEQRRSSGGKVASIGLAQTPSLRVPAQVSCAINCFVIHAQSM